MSLTVGLSLDMGAPGDDYVIRPYEPGDVDDFLHLYETVFDEDDPKPEWFAWKYEENPYVDHVPIIVAELGGTLVGARPFFALEMAVNGESVLALQPCDTMVHPDHRRNGLFTRMTDHAIERYASGEPGFFFNFPNEISLRGYLKLGWEQVGGLPRAYRIVNPRRVGKSGQERPIRRLGRMLAAPLSSGYLQFRDTWLSSSDAYRFRVEEPIPAGEFTSIYHRGVPHTIHVRRDERFYNWRFNNPDWAYRAYLTEEVQKPVGLITASPSDRDGAGASITRIVDVVPLRRQFDDDQTPALIHRVIEDNPESDLFVAPRSVIDSSTLHRLGFLSDTTLPLSLVMRQRRRVAFSLGEDAVNGLGLLDEETWTTTFADLDTA